MCIPHSFIIYLMGKFHEKNSNLVLILIRYMKNVSCNRRYRNDPNCKLHRVDSVGRNFITNLSTIKELKISNARPETKNIIITH